MNTSIKTIFIITFASLALTACDKVEKITNQFSDSTEMNQVTTSGSNNEKDIIVRDNREIIIGRRVALLIANEDYLGTENSLRNPINDANLLARSLEKKGFKVTIVKNADRANMITAIDNFAQMAEKAESAVFYYSGHGLQDKHRNNYLIPVNAQIQGETSIKGFGVDAYTIVEALKNAKPRASWIILDACRNNPFKSFRGSSGLSNMQINTDQMLISYATESGKKSLDYTTQTPNNSPYAVAINNAIINADNKPLLTLFDGIADNVQAWTNNDQKPTKSDNMRTDTYLLARADEEKIEDETGVEEAKAEDVVAEVEGVREEVQKINNFILYKDGTALDTKTNLLWKRCRYGEIWTGTGCTGEATNVSFDPKMDEDGWRIPSVAELSSLRYCNKGFAEDKKSCRDGGTGLNNQIFPTPENGIETDFPNCYESSSLWGSLETEYGYLVFSFIEGTNYSPEDSFCYTRLVRNY